MSTITAINFIIPPGLSAPLNLWKPVLLTNRAYANGFDQLVRNVDRSARKQRKLNPPVRTKVRPVHYQILLWMTSVVVTTKPASSTTSCKGTFNAAVPNPLAISISKWISGKN